MTSWGFVNHFVFFGLLIIVSVGTNQGEDVCSLSGGFCGSVGCSPVNNNETFKCDCGGSHYFNATSKRCLHRASCQVVPCQHSICIDDDGHSEATCTCDGVPHMASDCRVDAAFHNQCAANGGTVVMASEDGRSVPKCGCPIGTKHLTNGTCESIACLLPNLTCEEICRDVKLREDMRCCQNWTKDRCDESPQPGTFCEPGTIWNEANKTCTNACAATVSGPVCEHGCTYADPMAPAYQCKCGEDQQLSPDGLYCELKSECSGSEVDICSREGRVCFFENRKVLCKCPLEGAHFCSDMSSSGKKHDGVSFLSSCTVKGNTEVCTCHPPLRWDAESKLCVLAEEYRYAVFFERKDFQGHSVAWEQCSDRTQNEIINSAMKNLYGLQLQGARIVNCSVWDLNVPVYCLAEFPYSPEKEALSRFKK